MSAQILSLWSPCPLKLFLSPSVVDMFFSMSHWACTLNQVNTLEYTKVFTIEHLQCTFCFRTFFDTQTHAHTDARTHTEFSSDAFTFPARLHSQLGYSEGVTCIAPVCWSIFGKSILNKVVCQFYRMENNFLYHAICLYLIFYVCVYVYMVIICIVDICYNVSISVYFIFTSKIFFYLT